MTVLFSNVICHFHFPFRTNFVLSELLIYTQSHHQQQKKLAAPDTSLRVNDSETERNSSKWESYAVDLWRNYIYSIVEACTFNFHLHDDCCWWWWYFFSTPTWCSTCGIEFHDVALLRSDLTLVSGCPNYSQHGRASSESGFHSFPANVRAEAEEMWCLFIYILALRRNDADIRARARVSGTERKNNVPMINVPAWGRANRFSLFFSSQSCFSAYHLAPMAARILTA